MRSSSDYASAAATRRAIKSIEQAGYQVGSVHLLPDGTIQVHAARGEAPRTAENDFDRLEQAGLL